MFSNTTLKIINGSIRKIDRTNLTYVEPHRIIINDITFLAFNYSNEIFIENLYTKIKLSELENYLKTIWQIIINHLIYEPIKKFTLLRGLYGNKKENISNNLLLMKLMRSQKFISFV